MPAGIVGTPEAISLILRLQERHGPLLFHQSSGCCDGSVPLCFRRDEFRVGSRDVLFGVVEGTPFYVKAAQFEYLAKAEPSFRIVW